MGLDTDCLQSVSSLPRVEQILNLGWLVAVAGIVFAVAARPDRRFFKYKRLAVLTIFACVAVLLFPVISASDDLHPACVLGEDGSGRHDKRSLVQSVVLFVLISLPPLLWFASNHHHNTTFSVAAFAAGHLRHDDGRSPPTLS